MRMYLRAVPLLATTVSRLRGSRAAAQRHFARAAVRASFARARAWRAAPARPAARAPRRAHGAPYYARATCTFMQRAAAMPRYPRAYRRQARAHKRAQRAAGARARCKTRLRDKQHSVRWRAGVARAGVTVYNGARYIARFCGSLHALCRLRDTMPITKTPLFLIGAPPLPPPHRISPYNVVGWGLGDLGQDGRHF